MNESIRENFLQLACQYLFGKVPASLKSSGGNPLSLC